MSARYFGVDWREVKMRTRKRQERAMHANAVQRRQDPLAGGDSPPIVGSR